jgi:hypothetical protein|tara:strand:+ start:309 stop:791 length:483 start_codon:yes stop_codon:yes gene_type:complete
MRKKVVMTIDELIQRIQFKYTMLSENHNWGERGLFYNPGNKFSKGAYVLTFKEKDGKNDASSDLNADGKYRLNLKISKATFISLFENIPKRPAAGEVIDGNYNFSALDTVMPHPIYGWMTWVCAVNPTRETIDWMESQGLFEEAYQAAVMTMDKKIKALK